VTVESLNGSVGARKSADQLRDARIALDLAVIAAGRTLADREHHIRQAS
jgi:hypothetical protein